MQLLKRLLIRLLIGLAIAGTVFYVVVLAKVQLLAGLWIPSAMLLFLLGFPLYAVPGNSSLFHGLFDLDLSPRKQLPIRHFVVALASFAVAGTAISIVELVLHNGPARFAVPEPHLWPRLHWLRPWIWFGPGEPAAQVWRIMAEFSALAVWVAGFAVGRSWTQNRQRSLWKMIGAVAAAIAVGSAGVWLLFHFAPGLLRRVASATVNLRFVQKLGPGYVLQPSAHTQGPDPWVANLAALCACLVTLAFYIALGYYGLQRLRKASTTVPALVSLLMAIMVLGWIGAGAEFLLGEWHTPLLLPVLLLALINPLLPGSDHTYEMTPRNSAVLAAEPSVVLGARDRKCVIVAAAAGGGIQAAAWTAKVLEGLRALHGDRFDNALCCLSGISGGSMGAASYVNWLAGGRAGRTPFDAASASSLDEVAWGLAWPDLWRIFVPWPFRKFDRAWALEKAWLANIRRPSANGASTPPPPNALSEWNGKVIKGELPALIMSSTMVECGGPLLIGTTKVAHTGAVDLTGWLCSDDLHVDVEGHKDIPVMRGARLSATFPYVTPVAKPKKAKQQPHMIDGGFYDNYGMATLTEWLDQALETTTKSGRGPQIEQVLVLQINGFQRAGTQIPQRTRGGWLFQAMAPLEVLVSGRTAGQVSHRNIEFEMLKQKWACRGIQIEDAPFEFAGTETPPLSWHLMPLEIQAIDNAWNNIGDESLNSSKQKVAMLLASFSPQPQERAPEDKSAEISSISPSA